MAVGDIVPVPGDSFEQRLASASPDLLREMIREFAHLPRPRGIIRLVGAVLAEQDDEWTESRRYMGLEILAACRKATQPGMGQNSSSEAGLTVEAIPA